MMKSVAPIGAQKGGGARRSDHALHALKICFVLLVFRGCRIGRLTLATDRTGLPWGIHHPHGGATWGRPMGVSQGSGGTLCRGASSTDTYGRPGAPRVLWEMGMRGP